MSDELNENTAMEDGELSDEELEGAAGGGEISSSPTPDQNLEGMERGEEDELKDPTKDFDVPLAGFEDSKG